MDALRSTQVLAASTVLAALGLYALYKGGAEPSRLIDTPETVGRRVDVTAAENGKNEKEEREYDIVIVGGGTAGCVLAARLSENRDVHVLLLEAGGSSRDILSSLMPAAYSKLMGTHMDYKLFTQPQANAGGVPKYWPRARLLGGCSAMNAMMFHAGAPTDYDEWALSKQEGASGWEHKQFLKYFLKFEKFIPHPRYPNVNPSLRGANGPIKVGYFGYIHTICAKWIDSCLRLGIPFNPDINTPVGTLGVTKVMTYIDSSGRRVTTENAYLTPEVLQRPNLKVAVHSHVTRIIFETHAEAKRAVGVEFSKNKDGPRYRVRARREVVLSAGAVHSPHILMLSGVGPKDHLAEYNIPLVHDLPGIGQNLQDHISTYLRLRAKQGSSMMYLREPKGLLENLRAFIAFCKWKMFGSGPLTTNLAEAAAFMRTDDPNLFPPDSYDIRDESSGPNAPNLETFIVPIAYGSNSLPSGDLVTSAAVLLRPQSWGTITLKSADPFDAPMIDPRYLSTQNDVATLVRALRLLMRTAQTEPFASSIVHDDHSELDHNLHRLTDNELELEVRKRAQTLYHPTSTCRMASLEDGGVVDPYLRVHGIKNLRVADASIFPRIPSGHTAAPSIAVGEKAADLIKDSLSRS